jgi:hypothetical protein
MPRTAVLKKQMLGSCPLEKRFSARSHFRNDALSLVQQAQPVQTETDTNT